jgi:hypothetical protein
MFNPITYRPMSTMHVTTSQRAIAYALLVSQLLTSCGWNETILPSKKQEGTIQQEKIRNEVPIVDLSTELVEKTSLVSFSAEESERTMSIQSTLSPTSYTNSQEVTSSPLILQAKGGHQVTVNDHGSRATVQERVQPPFQRTPLTLPIRKAPQVNLQHLAQQEKKVQERLVQVVFPEQVKSCKQQVGSPINGPYQQGYVLIAEQGLKGGAPGIRLDIDNLIKTIADGYRTVGMKHLIQESIWRSMLNELANIFAQIPIDFSPIKGPVSPSTLDPGNVKTSFEAISSKYTGRNVRLDNYGYGSAYVHIISQVRNQITQKQSINIDPAKYPSSSYDIYLKASSNLFNMFPLAMEAQKITHTSLNGTVTFDLGNLLNVVEVEVRFNSSFGDFERREREQQEKERKEKEDKQGSNNPQTEERHRSSTLTSEQRETATKSMGKMWGGFKKMSTLGQNTTKGTESKEEVKSGFIGTSGNIFSTESLTIEAKNITIQGGAIRLLA